MYRANIQVITGIRIPILDALLEKRHLQGVWDVVGNDVRDGVSIEGVGEVWDLMWWEIKNVCD